MGAPPRAPPPTAPPRPPPPPPPPAAGDLSWVDEWVRNVRDYVFVREEDSLFIQRPNKAFKLNPAGARMLRRMLDGEGVERVLGPHAADPAARRDTGQFLNDVRLQLRGGMTDTYESSAVEKIPFGLNFSPLPVLSEVAVTYRCNAACTFCYAGCNCTVNPVGNGREMTLDEVRRVLDRIAGEAKVPSVSFTGGEATLRPDLPDMVRHARSLGMRVNLVTNGILLADPARVARLAEAGLQSAQVSVEGTTAAVHEAITRIPGSFRRSLRAVENLRGAGLRVHTNTTITRSNVEDVEGIPDFVKGTPGLDRFSMNLVIPTGSAPVTGSQSVSYTEAGPILRRIRDRSRALGLEFMWYSPLPLCLFNTVVEGLGNRGCSACDGLLSVGADGQVLPCASFDRPVGSLLDRTFADLWASPEARSFRSKGHAPAGCAACEDFAVCNGACPLYWREAGTGELAAARAARARERRDAGRRIP